MRKKLAIKGHSTRGKEVIEILEMMGGKNCYNLNGLLSEFTYYVIEGSQNEIRGGVYLFGNEDMYVFTLEEFLAKYPFKIGDKVIYTKFGDNCDDFPVTIESMKWTGTTIEYTFNDCVTCLAKDLKMWNREPDTVISGINLNSCDYADEVELNLGDYEIVVRDGKTYAVKKPKYPTTYEECYDEGNTELHFIYVDKDERDLYESFIQLIRCRNVYWKIAGEQMGLDKPWEPGEEDEIFIISYNRISGIYKSQGICTDNFILSFPTEEMRDAFYNNFKDLIEKCKKLI